MHAVPHMWRTILTVGNVKGASGAEQTDLNLLYWSEETATVDISALEGRCYVRYPTVPSRVYQKTQQHVLATFSHSPEPPE